MCGRGSTLHTCSVSARRTVDGPPSNKVAESLLLGWDRLSGPWGHAACLNVGRTGRVWWPSYQ
jgi:hypothetical protein